MTLSERIVAFCRGTSYAFPAVGAAILLLVLNIIVQPSFADPASWGPTFAAATPFILISMAQAPAVLSGHGGIDLSVGPLAGLVNAIIVTQLVPAGLKDPVSLLVAVVALGAMSGLLNGLLIAWLRLPPVIATLGTFLAYGGLTLVVLPQPTGSAPAWLSNLTTTYGKIFPGMALFGALVAIAWIAIMRTAYRRNLIATGSDERAAYTAGIDVMRTRILAYILSGVFAAIAGLAVTGLIQSGDPSVASNYTLDSIAGVALGGVAISGGRGGLLGPAAGGAVLFLTESLLNLAGVNLYGQQAAFGVIVLLAISANSVASSRRRGSGIGARPRRIRERRRGAAGHAGAEDTLRPVHAAALDNHVAEGVSDVVVDGAAISGWAADDHRR